jgi:4-aminobutyrate aminotransferase/(S)-3-amino-2-methylpropionate transaminase
MAAIRLRTEVPGPRARAVLERKRRACSSGLDTALPVVAERAKGALLTDVDGNRFIDFTGGVSVVNSGHLNPFVAAAARRQLGRLWHSCFPIVGYESYVRVCERLNRLAPGPAAKKSFLANSGAEAVENAVKIARRATGRPAVVSFDHAFHGRTLLALTLTAKEEPYKHGFGPFAPECYKLPYPYPYRRPKGMEEDEYVQQLLANIEEDFFRGVVDPHDVACVVMELVAGEGGFIVAPKSYVRGLAKICKKNGILFVADEVQTGFCRTGRMFASEHYGLEPDLLTTAKSIANGLPLAAVTGKAKIMDALQVSGLGTTFGGNPVACEAALATLDFMVKNRLAQKAQHIGNRVMHRFAELERTLEPVGDARGLGAMCGLELVADKRSQKPAGELAKAVMRASAESGLLILNAGLHGHVLRTLMPLVITDEELGEGLDVLDGVLRVQASKAR